MMAKMVCVSFYFGEVDRRAFREKFGLGVEEAYPRQVAFACARGLMELGERALSMTDLGARHFNGLCALFHAPSVQRYLLDRDPDTAGDLQRNRAMAEKVAARGLR